MRPDVESSDLCKTLFARVAREHGFDVHHDFLGWYVVESHESEPDDGYSLGFDGRPHFDLCFEAWRYAANQIRKSSDAYKGVR